MHRFLVRIAIALLSVSAAHAVAQDVPIYTDGLLNGFLDYSYGDPGDDGSDFSNAAPFHNGAPSIAFTGQASFNAVSFAHPGGTYASGSYSSLRFFVNGGPTGGQNISLMLQTNAGTTPVLLGAVPLDGYIAGGAIPINAWAQVDVLFNSLAFNNDGSFDRIDIQTGTGAQPVLYIDDVMLVGAASASGQNYIFGDSFEPEYMFVPQWANSSIRVYQRTTNTTSFSFVREAPLGAGINPNAVAFAPDGGLWVVDDGNSKLLRYTLQSILADANPATTAQVGPTGQGSLYDLAFFGANAYVSCNGGILRYPVLAMTNGSNPVPTILADANAPVGLAFDPQGHLWTVEYFSNHLVRIDNPTMSNTINITITGAPINGAEGLAFDEYGSLWVADNNEPTMYAYDNGQLNASGSPAPIGQINMPTPGGHPGFTGYVGGIQFDRRGDVRANYEYDYTVRAFTATAAPWSGPSYTSYTSSELTALAGATTDPGRGGIAIWPVPSTVHR